MQAVKIAPSGQNTVHHGRWMNSIATRNTTRIVVDHGKVQHWLNGKKVVEYELWTPEWEKLKATGKWKDFPNYGSAHRGHIGLQDHGNKVYFRNIKIREL